MKTINLKGILNPMSDSEMKNVRGGAMEVLPLEPIPMDEGPGIFDTAGGAPDCTGIKSCASNCEGISCGSWCDGGRGICRSWPDPLNKQVCKICWHG